MHLNTSIHNRGDMVCTMLAEMKTQSGNENLAEGLLHGFRTELGQVNGDLQTGDVYALNCTLRLIRRHCKALMDKCVTETGKMRVRGAMDAVMSRAGEVFACAGAVPHGIGETVIYAPDRTTAERHHEKMVMVGIV